MKKAARVFCLNTNRPRIPAVENQATDRAFRIGQKRTVFVHRFITKNSFEEKIDAMLTGKQELADMTVASGEAWLARMSHEELKALFDRYVSFALKMV